MARASPRVERVPYLNLDAFSRFIGPKNWGQALINDELTTCLLDNSAQLNFITPAYAVERGMDIMSLDRLAQEIGGPLPLIAGMGSSLVEPTGFVLMNVKVPCVQGYNEDQVALVMDDPGMTECPVILGTSTLYWVMEVIKESEISKLAVPWSSSRISWLMRDVAARLGQVVVNDVANKLIAPLNVDEVVRVASKCTVPPFGHKVIHGKVNLVLHGCRLGSLRFCIDFKRLNSLTVKDSHPLPHICETPESLAGAAHYTTIDMNSGFWQVPMDDESKQYTTFTLGSMGLYECESMPFGLCNAPPTFQRLMLNCLGELNLTYCLIYLDDVIIFSKTEEEHLEWMRVVFDRFREHGLKLKPSKCEVFKTEINYLAHHISKRGVLPSKKNLEAIARCPPPDTYTKVKSFVGLIGHYRHFIKGFANIAAPLYDLTSGENKDKKSEHLDLPLKAREAFDRLKAACLQAPILAFPDFGKPFLLETDASGKGLGAVLSQKQSDGRYHPIAYASRIMTETEQRYHSNKQEFLALKWAVTEQFYEYLSPYGKNRNKFVVQTDNNPLTYIFSSANLDAAGQRWVAQLASYNFTLEYQKGKDNTVADFLSHLDDHLPPGEFQDYLNKIPYPGVKAVLDNAITPLNKRAKQGVRPDPDNQLAGPEVTVGVRPARLANTNITNWKLEQQEDPVLYQVVKHRKASRETFKEALLKVTDRKAVSAYVKSKEQLVMKNGLLYQQSKQGQTQETVLQFIVPQIHRNAALDGCHREAAHQGQSHSLSLMQE